jgi:hypothetical protein
MQGRFKMEYRLFTIVRYNYNYRDYNNQQGGEGEVKEEEKEKEEGGGGLSVYQSGNEDGDIN